MRELIVIIKKFCEQFKLELYEDEIELLIVDDIPEYVRNNDEKYYMERKASIEMAKGMLYEDLNGKWILLIHKQDCVNFLATVVHEYVHFCDYKKYSFKCLGKKLRELQEDAIFLYWTEFHATYLSYRFLISLDKNNINVSKASSEIINSLCVFYESAEKLDRHLAIDNTVRSFGSYVALYDEYPDKVVIYPDEYFFNEQFFKIYNFVSEHKTTEQFMNDYQKFKELLYTI